MTALDSSLIVAALAQWHEGHESARREAHGQSAPAHAYLESYSVLTRLPPPRRLGARMARDLLAAWFPSSRVLRPARGAAGRFVDLMAEAGVAGGSAYDALVALTAAEAGEELVTRDRRAEATYRRLGVRYRVVE